ncbi:MAG: acetyl-CoA carboxylase biotin carboxyl carrier protein subunit [Chloroflexi bacterium]|nr:acetyl-CoA carboxylase biotin carboxyl carrier protein subunit [Chloroflexota bacterium]
MRQEFTIVLDGNEYAVAADQKTITVNGRPFEVEVSAEDIVLVDGIAYYVLVDGPTFTVDRTDHTVEIEGLAPPRIASTAPEHEHGVAHESQGDVDEIVAIMPGKVVRMLVQAGQIVQAGDPLCVLEAMKMENELRAVRDSVVTTIHVNPGETVEKNQRLITLSPGDSSASD